ncbi:MAG TPA: LLM class flavin-dependent oxidoreductase [Nocardioides sp.]|nr:LLM class flavin-dependent oxidoreductase [Nocardioides sp.]
MTVEETRPLVKDGGFKLALFAFNNTGGMSMTAAEGRIVPTWENQVRLAQMADRAGFEAVIPGAKWRGYGGASDWCGTGFETLSWAAGIASVTSQTTVIATVQVDTIHPVLAAKQAVTIDHISGGRFGFNLVAGWNQSEMALFGPSLADHESRYDRCEEWIEFVKRMWSEDEEFDVSGRFYNATGVLSKPKPLQRPRPVIINAAASGRGQLFVADHADVCFTTAERIDDIRAKVDETRRTVFEHAGRSIKVMGCLTVLCRDTEAEARRHWDYCVKEKGDREAALKWAQPFTQSSKTYDEATNQRILATLDGAIAGLQTPQAVGTPEQVAAKILEMSAAGLDGVTISFISDWEEELERFNREVLPLLEQAGLREPFLGQPQLVSAREA